MNWIMTSLLVIGGMVCGLNFYLSFLRYPLYRLMHGNQTEDNLHFASGYPIVGSVFVAISLFEFWQLPWIRSLAILLILIDTGGLHWFCGVMSYQLLLKKQQTSQQDVTTNGETSHR